MSSAVRDRDWEAAYLEFETPEEEARKFQKRLRRLGATRWSRDVSIVELFCGRGGGLRALERMGFTRLQGLDISSTLVRRYEGPARCIVSDCRYLPFVSGSHDVLIVQGGLHHLASLPADLDRVLAEARRVLRSGGLFVVVEPWPTAFLDFVHRVSEVPWVRKAWPKLDAFAAMVEHETPTYQNWLSRPEVILERLRKNFEPRLERASLGKLYFVGVRRLE